MPDNLSLGPITPTTLDIDISGGGTSVTLPSATNSDAGLMSAIDKDMLDNAVQQGGDASVNNITVAGNVSGAGGGGPLSLFAAPGVRISSTTYGSIFHSIGLTANQTVALSNASGTSAVVGTAAPSSASAAGAVGEIRVTSTYVYVCIAANTWVRAAFATF